jgi:hypothetical protein
MKRERAFTSACGSLCFKPDKMERNIMDKRESFSKFWKQDNDNFDKNPNKWVTHIVTLNIL